MKKDKEILINLELSLSNLINEKKENMGKIAYSISEFAGKNLFENDKIKDKKLKFSEKVEDILISCLDLDHWGWEELPPTLTIKEIKNDLIPEIKKLLKLL